MAFNDLRNITANNNILLSYKIKSELPYMEPIYVKYSEKTEKSNRKNVYNSLLFFTIIFKL